MSTEHAVWDEVTEMMGDERLALGGQLADWFEGGPQRLLCYTSYYKFAAKMIGRNKRVLDVGCGEGLGTWILAAECGFARGIDPDQAAVAVAQDNWPADRVEFLCVDFLEAPPGQWDAVVAFGGFGHAWLEGAPRFLERVAANLAPYGVAVVGTPNPTGQASTPVAGHVNVYSAERLEAEMRRYFAHVFMFSANDEVVHTGFPPMARYLLALACKKVV